MSNWKTVRLGDICNTNMSTFSSRDKWSYINYLDTGNITLNSIESFQNLIVDIDVIPSRAKRKVSVNDILFSTVRPNQRHYGIIKQPIDNMVASTGFTTITAKSEFCNPFFVYYFLTRNEVIEHLQALAEQAVSTYPSIKASDIENLEISLPSIEEQRRIAGILGVLDDKIECNNRINRNLEQQAAALFRRWFVDFEFPDPDPTSPTYGKPYRSAGGTMQDSPLGPIPQGWQVGNLRDYCKVKSGFAFKSAWWQDSGIKVLKIKNIDSNNTLNLSDCSFVSEDKVSMAKDFLVQGGDLLIAMTGATIGKFTIVPSVKEQLLVNQRVGKFLLGDNPINKLPFLYLLLRQESIINEIINRGQGSAQPNISPSDIETIDIVLPNKQIIDIFNDKMQAIFSNLIRITAENQTLATLRDTLLPKLMNNQI